ncbi:hypothetical protein ACKKBF_B12665 [Auxenochlorella protothecoides x Auxenochlorella symbiontica]
MSTPARVAGLRLKDACTSSLKTRWYSSDAVKRYDEEKYGGWKSADILFAEKEVHRTVIGRWDWHAWQLLIGLLPAAVVAGIAYWARKDMEKVFGATLTYKRPAREDRHAAGAAQPRPDMPTGPASGVQQEQALGQRLQELETQLTMAQLRERILRQTGVGPSSLLAPESMPAPGPLSVGASRGGSAGSPSAMGASPSPGEVHASKGSEIEPSPGVPMSFWSAVKNLWQRIRGWASRSPSDHD